MSESESVSGSNVASKRALWRLGIAAAILLAEYLAVSFTLDAQVVMRRGGIWWWAGQVGALGPFLVATMAALLLVRGTKPQSRPMAPRRLSFAVLALHAVLAAIFGIVSLEVFGRDMPPSGPVALWLVGWALLALATPASLYQGMVGDWHWLVGALLRVAPIGGPLAVAAWLAGVLSSHAWAALSTATFIGVSSVLDWVGFELVADLEQRVIELEDFSVTVAPACSGIEGMGLYAALMTGFLVRYRAELRFPTALLILPLGIVLVWGGNVVRIAALMILGARVDPVMALGGFHSKAGWVLFCAITLGVAWLARSWSFFSKTRSSDSTTQNPFVPWLLPVLTWLAVGLVTSAFSNDHDPLYGVRVVAAGAVLWYYRATYRSEVRAPTFAACIVGAAVGVAWLLLPFESDVPAPGAGWSALLYGSWLGFRVLGAVVIVPICEELAFRGFLARWLTSRDFRDVQYSALSAVGILGSSVVFGLLHERWLLAASTGVVYALLLRRSGRLADAVAAHAASNAVIAIWVLSTSAWKYW